MTQLLRIPAVSRETGVRDRTIYNLVKAGRLVPTWQSPTGQCWFSLEDFRQQLGLDADVVLAAS